MTDETVREVCVKMRRNEDVFHHLYWNEYANRVLAAYEREMAAKDAEIAKHERCYRALELHCKKLEAEYLRATNALKHVLDYDFGDYKTPWKTLEVEGELMKGCVRCGNGFPLSIVDDIIFGVDALIEMANAIGEAQRIMKESYNGESNN